jgi:hypothetical protein
MISLTESADIEIPGCAMCERSCQDPSETLRFVHPHPEGKKIAFRLCPRCFIKFTNLDGPGARAFRDGVWQRIDLRILPAAGSA